MNPPNSKPRLGIPNSVTECLSWIGDSLLRLFGSRKPLQILLATVAINLFFIGIALITPDAQHNPTFHFREFQFITILSFGQLLACSGLAWSVFLERQQSIQNHEKSSFSLLPHYLWLIIAFGFAFLAADEILSIHEITDKLIHLIAGITETTQTDKIDDFIIVLYAIAALFVLYKFREEFIQFKASWVLFTGAFFFLGLTIALDLELSDHLIPLLKGSDAIFASDWRGVLEESTKLISECFFVAALFGCYVEAKRLDSARKS